MTNDVWAAVEEKLRKREAHENAEDVTIAPATDWQVIDYINAAIRVLKQPASSESRFTGGENWERLSFNRYDVSEALHRLNRAKKGIVARMRKELREEKGAQG